METPNDVVGRNLARIRAERRMSVRALSQRLGELGVQLLPSGVTKAENGQRNITVNELMALALALRVSPATLLASPAPGAGDEAPVTPNTTASVWSVWRWASARAPLWVSYPDDPTVEEAEDDFRRHAWPSEDRIAESTPAARSTRDLGHAIRAFLEPPAPAHASPKDSSNVMTAVLGPPLQRLQFALRRVVADVEELIGSAPTEQEAKRRGR